MTQDGQTKVLQKGFAVIRKSDYPKPCIKQLKTAGVWITYANFDTKAARDREFKVMLQKDWVIED